METKWLFIMMAIFFIGVFTAGSVEEYTNGQVKIACYEAAKVNITLKCDK